MSQFELTFWKTIAAAERHYHITEAANQRVTSRTMERTENYPRKLTVTLDNRTTIPADNLLSASFAGWDAGTGALDIGDRVDYYVYPTSTPTTKTRVFWGIITEISQASNGILTITAKDLLEKFEYLEPNTIIFKNYNDLIQKATTEGVGARSIDDIDEVGIVWPAVFVGVATTDIRFKTATGATGAQHLMLLSGGPVYDYWKVAQSFVALGDGLIGIEFLYRSDDITTGGNLQCAVQADLNGAPSGIDLAMIETAIGIGSIGIDLPVTVDFTDAANETLQLGKGEKYWIVWSCDATLQGNFLDLRYMTTLDPATIDNHYWWQLQTPVVGDWTESAADENIYAQIDFADYEECTPEDYYFDDLAHKIIVRSNGVPITTVDAYYSFHRGKVSYYYNTVTSEDIFNRLIGFEPDVSTSVNTDCDTTYSLYQTRGKSIAECFRELADTFETAGAYTGYQHIVASEHTAGGVDVIHVGFRPFATGVTFSHGADTATDDEIRIVSTNLKRTTNLRPASVIVVGRSANGSPVIVERDDRALGTSSFRTKSKLALMTSHTDEAINSIADADRKAWQILDSVSRGTWEGTIIVAGVYPDLFDLDVDSDTYGAGGHIDLNYSPLGIVAEEFHVKGIILHENTTEIQISNEDLLILNAITDARGRAERSESFVAPDDPFLTTFIFGFYDGAEDTTDLWCQLAVADSVIINDGVRVLCTKTTNTRYNTNTYHAEFTMSNGYTIDGTNHVTRIELWDAATAGNKIAEVVLSNSEHFPKWHTTYVIAEVHCKAA